MFDLFRKKRPGRITAMLNARLQPMDRAELEDAFSSVCDREEYGATVEGGGTMLAPNGEVENCDIEIALEDASPKRIDQVMQVLAAMLAPKGSHVTVHPGGECIAFGSHEGLALYLNGTELDDEVYATSDVNHVFDTCSTLLEGVGMVNSHWRGPTETALYMYGSSFDAMHERIAGFVAEYPLCQKSRIERIA